MIVVCCLKDLETICESVNPSHVISVIDPGFEPLTPKGVKYHLKLGCDDILKVSSDNKIYRFNTDKFPQTPPNNNHTNSIIKFAKNWNKEKPLVIHCWCGVSRSMAVATYFLCKEDPLNIDKNIRYIRSIAPHANPNKILINLFEISLNLDNKISDLYAIYPHTQSYDCVNNFAPVTIFNINDMKGYK